MNILLALALQAVTLALAFPAAAAEREYKTIDEFVKSLPSDANYSSAPVEGDLNQDGLSDTAIIFGPEGLWENTRIAVLLRKPTGGLYVTQESKVQAFGDSTKLEIAKGSLFVSLEAPKGAWGRYQFKFIGGAFRLIGLNLHVFDVNDDGGSGRGIDTDFNLLTGDIVFSKETLKPNGKTLRKRVKTKAIGAPCLFENFDNDLYFCMDSWKTQDGKSVSDQVAP